MLPDAVVAASGSRLEAALGMDRPRQWHSESLLGPHKQELLYNTTFQYGLSQNDSHEFHVRPLARPPAFLRIPFNFAINSLLQPSFPPGRGCYDFTEDSRRSLFVWSLDSGP
jgi:hypothetical protein